MLRTTCLENASVLQALCSLTSLSFSLERHLSIIIIVTHPPSLPPVHQQKHKQNNLHVFASCYFIAVHENHINEEDLLDSSTH